MIRFSCRYHYGCWYIQQQLFLLVVMITIHRIISFIPLRNTISNSIYCSYLNRSTSAATTTITLRMILNDDTDNTNLNTTTKSNLNMNNNLTRELTNQSQSKPSDLPFQLETLQMQYEALLLRDSSSTSSNPIKPRQINTSTCNIPMSHVTILKDLSLWSNDTTAHVPPILTSLERKRRLLEIELLQNLIHNDDETVSQLWSLWYSERGNQTATKLLYDATTYSNNPKTWHVAEHILRTLILEFGIYWVEPINRLATLYYIQGKYKESINLCTIILSIKPWHFGAISGMVGLYIQMNNITQAKIWSEKRLPSNIPESVQSRNNNQRRIKWVSQAVSDAKQSLFIAEQELQHSFGKMDPKVSYDRIDEIPLDDETISWQ